mmetsp:Transcript_14328/g.16475  ORF Transcript_14328/g.16475 Transcript_14328/m.16475 type:complete len:176 (+) Transcript_14328:47-574(+)|eukprot:CAMPEP_0194384552 /NCGR_PEP_ID=MMETSP0174-20130528/74799_1 /TAXON_ID=216777 /ORGANISM="Proboscia alata, Strain PI-D3" /LENGTH=175 /DNA_ID=CAMNT_0039171843 /DNA_START=19 /DNA_END=546 /DNA_ORIENTATION=+
MTSITCPLRMMHNSSRLVYYTTKYANQHVTKKCSHFRNFGSISDGDEKTKSTYIHPLSQIVLEHLQKSKSDWVTKQGLETGLHIKDDGTFELRFPPSENKSKDGIVDGGKIYTNYEPEEKKHWLIVNKGTLMGQYMLQDNMKPAWHSDQKSTPERVQNAVDKLIAKISETEASES